MKVNNPHDKFLKETLSNLDTTQDFLTNYLLAEIMGIENLKTLAPQKDSYINEKLEENFF